MTPKVNRNDYVTMIPQLGKTYEKCISSPHHGISIRIQSNIEEAFSNIFAQSFTFTDSKNDNTSGEVYALYVPEFVHNAENDLFIPNNGYMSKTDKRYKEGIENTSYVMDHKGIVTLYYPYHTIVYMDTKGNSQFFVCGHMGAMHICLMSCIKQVLSLAYQYKGLYAIHASAVSDDHGVHLFLGGGRAGKTTLFFNMVGKGYMPLNDDIVFLGLENNEIYVYALPLLPSLRKESIQYILNFPKQSLDYLTIGIDHEYYIDVERIYGIPFTYRAPLKQVYLPKTGYQDNYCMSVKGEDYKKRILRCFRDHNGSLSISGEFSSLFYRFISYSFLELKMSTDTSGLMDIIENLS